MSLNLDRRVFIPIENSSKGVVDERTEFHFMQKDQHFWAKYEGGDILSGHIIGHFIAQNEGQMLYHCETQNGVLKAGRANVVFGQNENDFLTMNLRWEWISGAEGSGQSKYIEISETRL